jgi:hypothetical protein
MNEVQRGNRKQVSKLHGVHEGTPQNFFDDNTNNNAFIRHPTRTEHK